MDKFLYLSGSWWGVVVGGAGGETYVVLLFFLLKTARYFWILVYEYYDSCQN